MITKNRLYTTIQLLLTIVSMSLLLSCTSVDINNEQAVMKEIQGTWVGYEKTGSMYRHVKLKIAKESFEGWQEMTDDKKEPIWSELPNESGLISPGAVQKDSEKGVNYRKFSFVCPGRCCGDKSLTLMALSTSITYQEGKGLTIGKDLKMKMK